MRGRFAVLAVTLAACVPGPVMTSGPESLRSVSPKPAADVYACAFAKINQLGYTVKDANRDSGLIKAERLNPDFRNANGGAAGPATEEITAAVFPESSSTSLRVTVGARTPAAALNPSAGERSDATSLANECGGRVVEALAPAK